MTQTNESPEKSKVKTALPHWQQEAEIHDVATAKTRDAASPVWDMSQERAFMENLMNQRFTFFLVFFSAIIAGVVNSKSELATKLLLGFGSAMTSLFARILWRSHKKLCLIFEDLKTDKSHPITIIDRRAGRGSVRWILGWGIPWLCCGILIVGFVLAMVGRLPSFSETGHSPNDTSQQQLVSKGAPPSH